MKQNTTLFHPNLFSTLEQTQATIIVDTNVFSTMQRSKSFIEFLEAMKQKTGCAYATIETVLFETTISSSSREVYEKRTDITQTLLDAILPTNFISKTKDFNILMAKLNASNTSFTDFQLAACLYQHRNSRCYLLTSDQQALPTFFDREFVITAQQDGGRLVNFGFFRFNNKSYVKAAESVLSQD